MHNCEDLFTESLCWWRNKYVPCCSFFHIQRSEYGLCYSFNSLSNDAGRAFAENSTDYPWRVSNYGDWSGIRLNLNTTPHSVRPGSVQQAGLLIMVHDPEQWPNSGYFIPSSTMTAIVIKPIYSYATTDVRRLTVKQRKCYFPVIYRLSFR